MPEDFTWSCKRRYKKSYVWRDLLDDDHEYVLKGSQMRSNSNSSFDANSYLYGKKACCFLSNSQQAAFQLHQNTKMNNIQISKTSSSGPERSNLQGEQEEDDYSRWNSPINHKSHNSYFYSNLSRVNVVDNKYKQDMASSSTTSSSPSSHSSSQSQPTDQPQSESIHLAAGKRTKSRHLSMFRNLINCGGVEDTNDVAFVGTNARQDIIKADHLRRKKREKSYVGLFGTCMNHQVQPQQCQKPTPARKNDDGEYGATKQAKNQRADSSAFRPIGGPHCSHCRKQFNPEKLHSHMKSCRGVKALSKAAAVSVENKMP